MFQWNYWDAILVRTMLTARMVWSVSKKPLPYSLHCEIIGWSFS